MQRRTFLTSGAMALLAGPSVVSAAKKRPVRNEIALFEKPLQSLPYDELADVVAKMGFDGIEAAVRKKGHIEPEHAVDELPKLVAALKARGLKIQVMATSITSVDEQHSEAVLRTAKRLGIERYRLSGIHYDLKKPILSQLDDYRTKWRELAAFNRELGIAGVYQNHAGSKNVGGPIWDLRYLLEGIEPTDLGVAYDIRHAMVEGSSAWPVSFQLIRPHVQAVYVKDFVFQDGRAVNVPMGDGLVGKKFYDVLRTSDYTGPISLHVPHVRGGSPTDARRAVPAISKDLATLKKFLSA
jgi:sugar phosphate isomerase/epimerase